MKITKYNQSCLLINTNGKRILVDPGTFGYTEKILNECWINIDKIFSSDFDKFMKLEEKR